MADVNSKSFRTLDLLNGGLYENDQITQPYHRPAWIDYKWLNMGGGT